MRIPATTAPSVSPQMRPTFWLRQAPRVTVLLFLVPVAAGLAGTVLPAFG